MDYYCKDQFNTLAVQSADPGVVRIGPCCASNSRFVNPKTFNFDTDSFLTSIRLNTIQNQPDPACNFCWRNERAGVISRRLSMPTTDYIITPELQRLDITCQNICNLACIQCGPQNSSTWEREMGITDKDYSYADKISLYQNLDLSKVEHIHFTGGEPLMTKEHVKLLKQQPDLSKLLVSYNTNATFYPDQEVIDLWSKCKTVVVLLSVDAIGPAAEFTRWPTNWGLVEETINKFNLLKQQLVDLLLHFNTCVGNYNLLELPDVLKFATQFDLESVIFQTVQSRYFDLDKLPESAVDDIKAVLNQHPQLEPFVQSIAGNDQSWQLTEQYLDDLAKKRNIDWRTRLKIAKYKIT